jgi:hypothetical protein
MNDDEPLDIVEEEGVPLRLAEEGIRTSTTSVLIQSLLLTWLDDLLTNCNLVFDRRTHYALTREEITKGIANRFVHSKAYILLYLGMAALSVTTVVLSLAEGCPPTAFYVLEIIINGSMILEVTVRLVAFGRVCRWVSCYLNVACDLIWHRSRSDSGSPLSTWWIYA